jgi:hypothetical protein
MELWSGKDEQLNEAELRTGMDKTVILTVNSYYTAHITLDRKHLKDLFNAIGNEIGYWEPTVAEKLEKHDRTLQGPEDWKNDEFGNIVGLKATGPTRIYIDMDVVPNQAAADEAIANIKKAQGDYVEVWYHRSGDDIEKEEL